MNVTLLGKGSAIAIAPPSHIKDVNTSDLTNIAVSREVKRAIASRGSAGQSFNDVLKRLLGMEQNTGNAAEAAERND